MVSSVSFEADNGQRHGTSVHRSIEEDGEMTAAKRASIFVGSIRVQTTKGYLDATIAKWANSSASVVVAP
jgi:hypothetical protein